MHSLLVMYSQWKTCACLPALLIDLSVYLFLVLENLDQTILSNCGSLEEQQDFQVPEFVSTTTVF